MHKDSYESYDEDITEGSMDDLYKNYKINYLKEKLKWANEYLKKNRDQVVKKDVALPITYSPLKKKKIKGLDDVADLLLPQSKKYQSLSDLARNMSQITPGDQNDVINLLLSCRDLEKLIEEQHCVLDMLDNDMKEINSTLKLTPNWDLFENVDLLNDQNLKLTDKNLPLENTPLFIKGKVEFLPKNLEAFLNDDEKPMNKSIPTSNYTSSTPIKTMQPPFNTNKSTVKNVTATIKLNTPPQKQVGIPSSGKEDSLPSTKSVKYYPKIIKPKMKATLPINLKRAPR